MRHDAGAHITFGISRAPITVDANRFSMTLRNPVINEFALQTQQFTVFGSPSNGETRLCTWIHGY